MTKNKADVIYVVFFLSVLCSLPLVSSPFSCGMQINSSGTRILDTDLNCSGTALIINNDSVVLDCAGRSINYSWNQVGNGIETQQNTIRN